MGRLELEEKLRQCLQSGDRRGALLLVCEDPELQRRFKGYFQKRFPHDWEDLHGEFIVRLWQSIDTVSVEWSLVAWVWGVASKTAEDHKRKKVRRTRALDALPARGWEWMSGGRFSPGWGSTYPSSQRTLRSLRRLVESLRKKLPKRDRKVLDTRLEAAQCGRVVMRDVAAAAGVTLPQGYESNRTTAKVARALRCADLAEQKGPDPVVPQDCPA